MERLKAPFHRLARVIKEPTAPELRSLTERLLRGEGSEIPLYGKTPIIDDMGSIIRIRFPWGKDGLEKSYLAQVDPETRKLIITNEGFFVSDKHDWPKKNS